MLLAYTRFALFVLLLSVASLTSTRSATGAGEEAAPTDSTVVDGQIPPDLVGRWLLAVEARSVVGGQETKAASSVILRTFEVHESDGRLAIAFHRGNMPEELKGQIDIRALPPSKRGSASAEGGAAPAAAQRPRPETMAELARVWPSLLSATDSRTTTSRFMPYARVAADEKVHLNAPDARSALQFEETYPGVENSPPRESVTILALEAMSKDRMSGKFEQAISVSPGSTAAASFPFAPVPIRLEGDFVAYRVPDSPDAKQAAAPSGRDSRSFLGSLFSGCGG